MQILNPLPNLVGLLAPLLAFSCHGCQRDTPTEGSASAPVLSAPSAKQRMMAAPNPSTVTIRVFFSKDEKRVVAAREVPRTAGVVKASIEELLKGPTVQERNTGITSFFSEKTAGMVHSVKLDEQGHLVVDFKDFSKTIPGASTSAGSMALLDELNSTVFQYGPVKSVDYMFDGNCTSFWHWLQRECTTIPRPGQ